MSTQNFLLEIGTEEMPPLLLNALGSNLSKQVQMQLDEADLVFGDIIHHVTPRRLTLIVKDLSEVQPNRQIERKGPRYEAAFDVAEKPTKACEGFARSCGTTVDQLEVRLVDGVKWLYFSAEKRGQVTIELLPEIVKKAVAKLPLAKSMRWGSREDLFVRPVHWVVQIFGTQIVEGTLFDLPNSNQSYGHRFMAPEAIKINSAETYLQQLKDEGKVIADFNERKEIIRKLINESIDSSQMVKIDETLLEEVTGLVEWPVALVGQYDARFLEVPAEVLITSMKKHQKCFPVRNKKGDLVNKFVTISNIESKNPSRVVAGNERVIRARLSDAEFFYKKDLETSLNQRIESLKRVIFQNKLGSLYEKSMRMAKLSKEFANSAKIDSKMAERAAWLAKTDLLTEMVGEFPELQGIVGQDYALKNKEPKEVSIAISEQYLPRFAGDLLPETDLGWVLALADRIDTLVGIIGIGQKPKGDKDPFALRRAALGILRIIIEHQLDLDLEKMIIASTKTYGDKLTNPNVVSETIEFIMDRLKSWYVEQGIPVQVFMSIIALYPTRPYDFQRRLYAVEEFLKLPEAESLTMANKRVSNILKKQETKMAKKLNHSLLTEQAEQSLAEEVERKKKDVDKLYQAGEYTEALCTLASLRKAIDGFFDDVMVMVDNEALRENRLALLSQLRELFTRVADISLLPTN